MMWSSQLPPDGNLAHAEIRPDEVLYEYDGPLIYRSRIGLVDLILNKVRSNGPCHRYVACQTDSSTIDAVRAGKISLYGAFDRKSYWIIDFDSNFRVQAYWNCLRESLPSRFLPKPGLGLFYWQGAVPDTLEQANALLALKFRGATLSRDGIPLGRLKEIVDQTFSAFRKIFTPPELIHTRSTTFDVEVAPLRFNSLVIAAKEPLINMKVVRRIKALEKYSKDDLERAVVERARHFADHLQEIAVVAKSGLINQAFAEENFALIELLTELMPDERGRISSVEFSAPSRDGLKTIIFDSDDADVIRKMNESTQGKTVTETGIITGMMTRSNTIKIRSLRGKDVTCSFNPVLYAEILSSGELGVHKRVQLIGQLTRRARVDWMNVDQIRFVGPADIFR